MSKKNKTTVTLFRDGQLTTKKLSPKKLLKELERTLALPPIDNQRTLGLAGGVDTVTTLAQYAPDGVAHAGTLDWNPPATGAGRVPLGLDDSGRALHALIAARAASSGQPYFHAMADVTGIPDYRSLSDVPPALTQQQGLDPERAASYTTGRALASNAGISWMDAMAYLDHLATANELQGDDGSAPADAPWLDSRPLATPPRPWSDDDWQRDQRRANAAGLDVDKAAWQAGAEQGRDVVGEAAGNQRAEAIATHQANADGFLDQARAREDDRRSSAINDELIRRARNRVASNGRGL